VDSENLVDFATSPT